MGLTPLGNRSWIETDSSLPLLYAHKLRQKEIHGENVYRCAAASLAAQKELSTLLLRHLTQEQAKYYALRDDHLLYKPTNLKMPLAGAETLWDTSLWIADDLVLLSPEDDYRLTAASLCSPSHWRLQDKFGQPLWQVHNTIPGFHNELTPRIERFLKHLKAEHPVVRYNWSLQADDALHPDTDSDTPVDTTTTLYYRTERQSLRRLPQTGAIAFTIRVYLHPLESIGAVPGAMQALLRAIKSAPAALARYKDFDRLAPALNQYQ
jgi:hypothetical protein